MSAVLGSGGNWLWFNGQLSGQELIRSCTMVVNSGVGQGAFEMGTAVSIELCAIARAILSAGGVRRNVRCRVLTRVLVGSS
jgi:hypothetical protein